MTVADSVPQPLRKAVTRVEQQLRVAHWVGEMSVTMARNAVRELLAQPASTPVDASSPFDGYDALTAAQVVADLGSRSTDELLAIQVYEQANRARRTVLAKVEQLLATPQ